MKHQLYLSLTSQWTGLLLAGCSALWLGQPGFTHAAVTEAWVQHYSNLVPGADDRAFGAVSDAAGDIIVVGRAGQHLLTFKYSGLDGTLIWENRSSGAANVIDVGGLAVDRSGNVVITGSSHTDGDFETADYFTAKFAAADGALLWEKRYNGPGNMYDVARAVAVDGSGNVVVTGNSHNGSNDDYYTAKYAAADGALLWEKRYAGTATDYGRAVAVDGSDNVVVTGSSAGSGNYDYYTAKYAAADGALLWEERYNGGPANSYDRALAVAVDGNGNVVVTGTSKDDYYTAKYAATNGALLWGKRYNGPANEYDEARAVAVDSSGNVIVTGFSLSNSGSYLGSRASLYTAKYAAADGALLWAKRYLGPTDWDDRPRAVAVDGSGNVLVTATCYTGVLLGDFYTAKYAAADGALLWEQRFKAPGDSLNAPSALALDASGNVVVAGTSYTDGVGDFSTVKYGTANGTVLWENRYDGPVNTADVALGVKLDGSGNVAVTGGSYNGVNADYYTAKYGAADGALLWEKRYNGPANSSDQASAVAVDSSGNVIVTGFSNNGTNNDYYTAKYAASDGALLWERRYHGPIDAYATAVAVDSSGNVAVTGYLHKGDPNYDTDYYTAKYADADGRLLWERHYNAPENIHDRASAVAVDASGNVLVTGHSGGTLKFRFRGNSDYYTAKYAANDGALMWEKRYNGPDDSYDGAAALAVDLVGNVAVTGISFSSVGRGDYLTAKYAAADGALLWEKRYNSPTNGHDEARAVAVDGSGNVIVTGFSIGDFYTIKYAAADGALLWEKRYHGPGNDEDQARAIAVDDKGNVVVTGSSAGDFYTAKYAAADGMLLWEKRYPNGDASGLALGPNGMVAITGSDYITVVYRESLPPISIALVPTGVRLRFSGVSGRSYTIERALSMVGPWRSVIPRTAPWNGIIEYIDTSAQTGSAFYRMSE